MTTIAQLLREKGQAVFSIGPDETVYDALQKMAEANDEPVDRSVIADPDRLAGVMARQKAAWEPGTRQAYHVLLVSMGSLLGSMVVLGCTCVLRLTAAREESLVMRCETLLDVVRAAYFLEQV